MAQQPKARGAVPSHLFLVNPSNRAVVEGTSMRVASFTMVEYTLILILLVGAVGEIWAASGWFTILQLNWLSSTVQGIVFDRTETHFEEDTGHYYVSYQFELDGKDGIKRYTRQQEVSVGTYVRLMPGSKVTIRYLPEKQNVSRLGGTDTDNTDLNGRLLYLFIFPTIVLVALLAFLRRKRYRRLMRDGHLLYGRVTRCTGKEKLSDDGWSYEISLHYSFSPPDGHRVEGKKKTTVRLEVQSPCPDIGQPVAVLYLNDKLFDLL